MTLYANVKMKIFQKYQKYKNKNIIKSNYISPDSINGKYIEIGLNTCIDKKSIVSSYTYVGKNCNITKAEIGRYCSIANNVSIGQGEHDITKISTSSYFYEQEYDELTKGDCIIEHDVWIGTDAVILRGVTLGIGSVVGANAVVTKDIPPYAVAVGCPAKIIKYRFDLNIQNQLLDSKWWINDLEIAKEIIKEFKID